MFIESAERADSRDCAEMGVVGPDPPRHWVRPDRGAAGVPKERERKRMVGELHGRGFPCPWGAPPPRRGGRRLVLAERAPVARNVTAPTTDQPQPGAGAFRATAGAKAN